jgi:uncharacterized protein (DUF2225 family)
MIKAYVGTEGLKESWQDDFAKNIKCPFCGNKAHAAFGVCENFKGKKKKKGELICDLDHEGIWPHDVIAATVYICSVCGKGSVDWNQA